MAMTPGRGHEALRRGRWSDPGAEYFLTCCTDEREAGLERKSVMASVLGVARGLEGEGVWSQRTVVVMPDHVHLLVALGEAVALSAAVRLFKGRSAPALRTMKLRWERGYFDHRLRADEDRLPVFRYVFLNPYRAGWARADERWPGYFCAEEDWAWFGAMTDKECPWPEWLL